MQNLNALTVNAYPVLMAASRKTTIGNVLGAVTGGIFAAGNGLEEKAVSGEAGKVTTAHTVIASLPPEERLEGTLAVTASAVYTGANLVRVHDVKENVRLIRMLEAIRKV